MGQRGIEWHELASDVSVSDREGYAVAIGDPRPRRRTDALAGRNDAGQVERIGGADGEDLSGRLGAPHCSQTFDRFGQRELFARHA